MHDRRKVTEVKSSRLRRVAITVGVLPLLIYASSPAHSQNGFAPVAGEIKVRGVLARNADHPPKWLLRLEKPIRLDGEKTMVLEVMEPSPGPASPLLNGGHYEFTGRLDPQRIPPSLQVTTIRRLDAPAPTHKRPQSTPATNR